MILVLRSILFNTLFYINLLVHLVPAMAAMVLPQYGIIVVARSWARTSLWLLRVICGTRVEWRGLDKIPSGPLIVAAKHQSILETFALIIPIDYPTYILKRELMWIPLFGWCIWKTRMIPVDRGAGAQVIPAMVARAKERLAASRQIIIFPEGTRRAAGAEPRYKSGVAHLYLGGGVPCQPVALNSGLFWPRRSFRRLPGTVVIEFLDPIAPGLDKEAFMAKLQTDMETACARLVADGRRELAASGHASEALPLGDPQAP